MSVSLYWTASRPRGLREREARQVPAIVDAASAAPEVQAIVNAEDTSWEGLFIWDDDDDDVDDDRDEGDVLRGSSALPRLTPQAAAALLEHCCRALAQLREAVPGARWDVTLDDLTVPWDDRRDRYVIGPDHFEHYKATLDWEAGLV